MELTHRKSGFTLIELIIVIALLGILAAMAVPRFSAFVDRGRIAADQATLRNLNTATCGYKILRRPSTVDVFEGIHEDDQRMAVLVTEGFLNQVLEPQKPDAQFLWHTDAQKWLYSLFVVAEETSLHYDFKTTETEDFIYSDWGGGGGGTWEVEENGLHTTGTNGSDLLFIGNGAEEYTLRTAFKLGDESGGSGGMGMFFETILDADDENRDTGYILQFDRGYSEIILRKRVNGSESSSQGAEIVQRIGNKSTSTTVNETIPDNDDSDWWEAEKEISITVTTSENEGKKRVSISLDGVEILTDFEIESDIDPMNNHTGFRGWNGVPVSFSELTVDKIK
jgi:prepilin-type N-terminal cleavage/methylation domain-containing protein